MPNRFHGGAVVEGQRKFLGTLWNTYAFFVLYANIDKFDATKYTLDYDSLSVMDKWLLSKLNSLIKEVDNNLENYKITETSRVLQEFVDQLSNWYVRRSRERFWKKDMPQDKINAYMTLYTALVTLCKISAPMIPFMTEDIYQNLVRSIDKDAPESIHLCDFPIANDAYINKELELKMDNVLDIVVLGRAARNASAIKNRQPIGKMYVKADGIDLDAFYTDIIAEELNVKAVEFTSDVKAFTNYSLKPQLKTVGPKYGKFLGQIKNVLAETDGNTAVDTLDSQGYISFEVDGTEIKLEREDLLIDAAQMEGFASESDHGITVVLDTNLTEELIEEGFVREIISKIQTMRKDSDFDVMDNIEIYISDNEKIAGIINNNADFIKDEVLAVAINNDSKCDNSKEWNINGEKVYIGVTRK